MRRRVDLRWRIQPEEIERLPPRNWICSSKRDTGETRRRLWFTARQSGAGGKPGSRETVFERTHRVQIGKRTRIAAVCGQRGWCVCSKNSLQLNCIPLYAELLRAGERCQEREFQKALFLQKKHDAICSRIAQP